jgi:hypothetical protein
MRIYPLLLLLLSTTTLPAQKEKPVYVDTIVYQTTDTVIYKLLSCGLYLGSNGDIAYRTEAIINENFDRATTYITWIWGVDEADSTGGGIKEMKSVIDTATFKFLNYVLWADKKNVYGYTPMSDGGTVYLHDCDRKTFVVLGDDGYAKDKNHIYYRGAIISEADLKTFGVIEHKEVPELAADKFNLYFSGKKMTEREIKQFGLEKLKN